MHARFVVVATIGLGVVAHAAAAQTPSALPGERVPQRDDDPTGGAYSSPTLLFVPAGALPTWNVRAIGYLDVQGPTAGDRLASGTAVGFQPGIGGELGLPGGFTLGAGTKWVGGDVAPRPVADAISPYTQLRYHIIGDPSGMGVQSGSSLTYKFVGFDGDPGEMELAVSGQFRNPHYELGVQGVVGKDFGNTDADVELHAYAVYRVVPGLALGAAGQLRMALVWQPGETTYEVVTGGIASLTLGRWQLAGLLGESTMGLSAAHVGALGEVFAAARF